MSTEQNVSSVPERYFRLTDKGRLLLVQHLLNEVDCRIEHGADSRGHLEYVRERLREILGGF